MAGDDAPRRIPKVILPDVDRELAAVLGSRSWLVATIIAAVWVGRPGAPFRCV